jgi:hypothetical protein
MSLNIGYISCSFHATTFQSDVDALLVIAICHSCYPDEVKLVTTNVHSLVNCLSAARK